MKTLFAFDLHTLRQDPFAMERFNTEVFQCLKKYGTEQNIWQGIEPMVLLTKHQISGNSNFIAQLPHTVEKELLSFATRWDDHAVAAWCDLMQGKGKISEIYFDILQYLVNQYKIEYFVYWGSNHTIKKFCEAVGIYSAAMELGPTRPPFRETRYCDFAGVNGDAHIRHADIEQFEPLDLCAWRMSGGISFDDGSMDDSVFRPLTTRYAERIYRKKAKTALIVLQLDDDSNCLVHSKYSGMLEMLQEVVPQFLCTGWQVLVKPHPGAAPERNQGKARWRNVQAHVDCKQYLESCDQSAVAWLDDVPASEYTSLLSKVDAVVSVNSSVGFEAILLEKIVVALGNAPYNIQNKLPNLSDLLADNIDKEKYRRWCGQTGNLLLNYYLASENILSNPVEISAALRRNLVLADAFRQDGYTKLTDIIKSNPINLVNKIRLQRIASPFVERLAKKLLAMQVPYVYEIDDLLWDMPRDLLSSSAWRRNKKRLFFLLKNASAVTTSTQNIAGKLYELNTNVHVIPNVLCQEVKKNISFNSNAKLILSATDRMYINTVSSVLKSLQDTLSTEIIALGPVAHDLRKKGVQVNEFPVMGLEEYSAWLNSLDNVIALCPLDSSNFSKCKSAIKYHSYSLAGIPVLASNQEPYSNVIEHQHNGYLISQDTTAAWLEAILLHLKNPDLLEKYVKNASIYSQNPPDPVASWYDLLIRLYNDSRKSIHNFEIPSSWDWGYLRYFFSVEKYIALFRLIKQYGLKKIFLLLRKGM